MKKLILLIPTLILAGMFFYACQESITDTDSEIASLGKIIDGFDVVLVSVVDNGNSTYTWTWSITKITAKRSLSHWSFDPGTCLQREDIVSAWYRYGGSGSYTQITPIPPIQDDPSMTCDTEPVFKFNYGASGTTFYQLVLNKNYEVDPNAQMYWKAGNECGGGTFDGIGCPPCDEWIVYGSHYGYKDELFKVDLNSKTYSMLYDPGNIVDDYNYPNGNAYDPFNERVYFGTNDGRLFYHQLGSGTHVPVATELGNIASACWYNGKYYYVKNHTNELYEVDVTTGAATLFGYVPHAVTGYIGYGDIAWDPNNPEWIIGSVGDGRYPISEVVWYIFNVNTKESFILNKVGGTGLLTVGGICHKQLAFGSDGVLYALDTGNNPNTGSVAGRFYTVDINYSAKTYELTWYWDSGLQLNDLADGPLCQ